MFNSDCLSLNKTSLKKKKKKEDERESAEKKYGNNLIFLKKTQENFKITKNLNLISIF